MQATPESVFSSSFPPARATKNLSSIGTCATGCLYELNLTNQTNTWLQLNDIVKLEIEELGTLENKINLENDNE